MKELGFTPLIKDSGIFVHWSNKGLVIIVVYVDNIIFFGTMLLCEEKKKLFIKKWECRDLGTATEFLSMRIRREKRSILLDQTTYLDKVLECFGHMNAKPAWTLMVEGYYPSINKDLLDT